MDKKRREKATDGEDEEDEEAEEAESLTLSMSNPALTNPAMGGG